MAKRERVWIVSFKDLSWFIELCSGGTAALSIKLKEVPLCHQVSPLLRNLLGPVRLLPVFDEGDSNTSWYFFKAETQAKQLYLAFLFLGYM